MMHYRAQVNQPNAGKSFHRFHGQIGIVVDDDGETPIVVIYFTTGPVESTEIPRALITRV